MSPGCGGQGRWCRAEISPLTPGMPTALIPMNCDVGSPGVCRDQSLEEQQAQVECCWHPAGSGSSAQGLTLLSMVLQVKVWRLPQSGQDIPSSAGLTLGPGGGPVNMLQFHPTADGVLASGTGKRVTVWDMEQQQPLTGRHGCACQLLPAASVSTVLVHGLKSGPRCHQTGSIGGFLGRDHRSPFCVYMSSPML